MEILQKINGHEDLLRLNDGERVQLCREIREFLIANVSQTGGHLAGNLGAVELTVAIETVFNTMVDRLVFDVGHQSYVHKLLTGRRADFPHLRQFGGLSGFPKPSESPSDAFIAGHASSSVSIALGMARARTLLGEDYHVIALMGDGAATGGMAFEGLNDAAVSHEPMIIILNDNEMSIGKSEGGLSRHLSRIRSSENYLHAKRRYREVMKKLPGGERIYIASSKLKNRLKRFLLPATMFENMGLTYLGPVDGHNLPGLISLLRSARDMKEPVLVHVVTKKGCGYPFAEADPAKYHGIGKFDPVTGKKLGPKVRTFSDSFGDTMLELASRDPRVCAITAAMPGGTGLLGFMHRYPKRYFDVGIAEEHAVSMAGGLAKQGMIPVAAIYSTFLQRSFDQILQDVCMLHLHVVLAIDRAGLVGDDGPTHHGVFDVGFLRMAPGMLILAPVNFAEQRDMLCWAVESYDGPVAVRYPRGTEGSYRESGWQGFFGLEKRGVVRCHRKGTDVTLLTYGSMLENVLEAAELLEKKGLSVCVLRLLTLSVFPVEQILREMAPGRPLIVAEETAAGSGIREALASQLREVDAACRVTGLDLGKDYVPGGSMKELYHFCGLDGGAIAAFAEEVLRSEG
ncbi:MAG: 1-deoxy-D-xylulose-5-phosphate synthase [Clostridiales bacterium]|nr:1-deoxy-D-xylulose-5-phosphate synthase [Clostridiales bacterium]MCI7573323.1 1-deoxy-D-xylulose-5-phosphate synthase [Clostridiales bacterium]